MDGLDGTVVLHLSIHRSNGGIHVGGDRHGRGWRYDTEDAERTISRTTYLAPDDSPRGWRYDTEDAERTIVWRKVGRPAGLGGVPVSEN